MSDEDKITPRILIASGIEQQRDNLRELLESNEMTVIAAVDPSDASLMEVDKDVADMLLVDLSDDSGYEMDFDLLDALLEQCKLPLLFHETGTQGAAKGWDQKLVEKIYKMAGNLPTEQAAEKAPAEPKPEEEIEESQELSQEQFQEESSDKLELELVPIDDIKESSSTSAQEDTGGIDLLGRSTSLPGKKGTRSGTPKISTKTQIAALPENTVIDEYRLERVLSRGGFSIVYRAIDLTTGNSVVIKEYMPRRWAMRVDDYHVMPRSEKYIARFNRGRTLFSQEARVLATLKHPNIVNVLSFFQANGTAYMVMQYERGKNLSKYIRDHQGNLSERFLLRVFPKLLEGLRLVHEKGALHLDIKPGNIHLCTGGNPLLLDFGAVHEFATTRKKQSGHVITPGYSPIEQYKDGGYVGPWSDLYALGATMRVCIEGSTPPPSPKRHDKDRLRPALFCFKKRYSKAVLKAIDWAMEVDALNRPQSVDEFLSALPSGDSDDIDLDADQSSTSRLNWFKW